MIRRLQILIIFLFVMAGSGISFADISSSATGKWSALGTWVGGKYD